ncbi:hypothetical protein MVEN_01368100 [Mycena venus]|uniref:Uncharacterized protein n=1 Tax=Mycena venus TaxID=2733690 RepID=A0A8H7CUI9_9AGAR|nr:hypothetical protein MVEN_01368100 [Mycena venus]
MALSKVSLTPAMSTQVQKVEVTSPLIQYEGSWSQSNDQATFISCDDDDNDECLATLQLNVTAANGTKVMAFVAGCGPLSRCGLQVDSDPEVWGQFHNDNDQGTINATLDQGPHNVTMKGKEHFTLHYFNWTSTVHSTNDKQVPNDANAFVYAPQNAWNTNMADRLNGQMTIENNATATFSFKGDRVALYGAVGPQGGEYTTQLDDGPLQTLTEQRNFTKGFLPNQLIFYADGLDVAEITPSHLFPHLPLPESSPWTMRLSMETQIRVAFPHPPLPDRPIARANHHDHIWTIIHVRTILPFFILYPSTSFKSNSSSGHPRFVNANPFLNSACNTPKRRLTQAQLIGIITGTGAFLILLILALAYILYSRHVRRKKAIRAQESFNDFKFPRPIP